MHAFAGTATALCRYSLSAAGEELASKLHDVHSGRAAQTLTEASAKENRPPAKAGAAPTKRGRKQSTLSFTPKPKKAKPCTQDPLHACTPGRRSSPRLRASTPLTAAGAGRQEFRTPLQAARSSPRLVPPGSTPRLERRPLQVCDNCEEHSAVLRCVQCEEVLCAECNFWTHKSKKKMAHDRHTLSTRSRSPRAAGTSGGCVSPLEAILAQAAAEDLPAEGAAQASAAMFSPVPRDRDLQRLATESSDDELTMPLSRRLGLSAGLTSAVKPAPAQGRGKKTEVVRKRTTLDGPVAKKGGLQTAAKGAQRQQPTLPRLASMMPSSSASSSPSVVLRPDEYVAPTPPPLR